LLLQIKIGFVGLAFNTLVVQDLDCALVPYEILVRYLGAELGLLLININGFQNHGFLSLQGPGSLFRSHVVILLDYLLGLPELCLLLLDCLVVLFEFLLFLLKLNCIRNGL
jgi:hypothetical protein